MPETLSIVIVNYKTPGLLSDCLATVYSDTGSDNFEVIVVDNHSGDDSRTILLSAFPKLTWIQMDYNSGFARANNEGMRHASGQAVLLLNSDTLVISNAISDAFRLLIDSNYIGCGVQLLNKDGSSQISGNFFVRGNLNNLLPLPYVGAAIKKTGHLLSVRKPHAGQSDHAQEVDWINGAFLMVKTEIIRNAGMMDEDFFLYAEEAEWCARLRKFGKLVIYGHLQVVHLQGATSNTTFASSGQGYYNLYDKKGLQIMISNFVRLRKQWGSVWFLFQLLIYTLTIPIVFIGSIIQYVFRWNKLREALILARGFTSNVITIWKYVTTILDNKPHFYKFL